MIFKSERQLAEVLRDAGIDFSNWGQGVAKSVGDLWTELATGESTIEVDPLVRVVDVAEVQVEQRGRTLFEAEQEFRDGRRRTRNSLPAEKMRTGESSVSAAIRCAVEELCLDPTDVRTVSWTRVPKTVVRDSPSYPGLQSCYRIHRVLLATTSLPEREFWTEEEGHARADPVCRHRWIWSDAKGNKARGG